MLSNVNNQFREVSTPLSFADLPAFLFVSAGGTGVVTGSPPNLVVLSNLNKQFGDNSAPLSCAT